MIAALAGTSALVEAMLRVGTAQVWVVVADDLGRVILCGGVAWACWWRSRRPPLAFHPLWRALSWSLMTLGLATLHMVITHDLLDLAEPLPSLRHLGYLASMGFLGWGILKLPVESLLPTERIQALLDGLLISTAIFFISWGSFLRSLVEASGQPGRSNAYTLIYPLLSTALGAFWIFQESRLRRVSLGRPGLLLRLGLIVMVGWWPFYSVGKIRGLYGIFGISEHMDLLWLAGLTCFGLAACWPDQIQWPDSGRRLRDRPSLLPYLPSVVALSYGAIRMLRGQVFDWILVITGTLLGAVMMLRQYLAVRDLNNLSDELEVRVQARSAELLKSQRELARSQRTQLIAGLAAGFAHDFKNLLGVIRNWIELLRMDDPSPELPRGLEAIDQATTKALELVQDILAVGRQQELHPITFDLGEYLRACQAALEGVVGTKALIVVQASESPLPVFMDAQKLEHILLNLASNAADAMEARGLVTLRAWQDPVEPYALLEVQDNGKGIATEHLEHIFEPFYTTKPAGKGTGLGLSTVHGTLVQSGGSISVRSATGMGTTFTLRLPQEAGTSAAPQA
ncbi:sensor histidine kinase [Geothrix limicola]|uniref:sensor histidine kinase n=1 Tax=Geothrix limicola TaxID=2927978 RepID=UPI002557128A|nr:HAMP domain-containing sensor histidine kinase [Geothrix limicola]